MMIPVAPAPGYFVTTDPEGRVMWKIYNPDGSVWRGSNGRFYGETAIDDAYLAAVTHHMIVQTKISVALHRRAVGWRKI